MIHLIGHYVQLSSWLVSTVVSKRNTKTFCFQYPLSTHNTNNMTTTDGPIDVIIEIVGPLPSTGSRMKFKGLSTSEPLLEFEDGTTFVGEFQEVVGSLMVFSEEKESSAPGGQAEMVVSGSAGEQEQSLRKGDSRRTTLECIQDKKIVFRKKG